MDFKRTPDRCFEQLNNFDFAPHYLQVDDTDGGELRIHYLDEGPVEGDVVLLMHGQPVCRAFSIGANSVQRVQNF
jgi:haloalkane dehalogenase